MSVRTSRRTLINEFRYFAFAASAVVLLGVLAVASGCSPTGDSPTNAANPAAVIPTITVSPATVSMSVTGNNCIPLGSFCTVFQNLTITSSTSWTSSPPGFGSLGEGFTVSPDFGPIGSTVVAITYRYQVASPADGFIRFRTSGPNSSGVYVEVPVRLIVK